MNQPKDLLSIGAFANMTRLSIKALRLYDQLDLLQPHHVDPRSGYRYYEADQLPRARLIRNMREMDMPLATIRRVLAVVDISPAQAELLVYQYVQIRERQIEQIRQQARQIVNLFQQETPIMNLEVNIKKIPAQQIISITRHQKLDGLSQMIEKDIGALFGLAGEQGVNVTGAPFGIYHSAINEQEDGPIETCLPVDGRVEGRDDIVVKQLAGGNAACVTIHGEQCRYPDLLSAYDAAADWIQKNGYETAEPPREVWYTGPGPDAKWEIVWLFK